MPGQSVKVKVSSVDGTRVGLSTRDVNQQTGQDLPPQMSIGSGANVYTLCRGIIGKADYDYNKQQNRRMTSPERWEIRQLIAAGVAKASDYPDLEDDYNAMLKGDGSMSLEETLILRFEKKSLLFLMAKPNSLLNCPPYALLKPRFTYTPHLPLWQKCGVGSLS
ncbi:hypothetical protein N7456_012018 [Penicillium angulare]|uniref:S1 motif domain-containing protein n=1 Tax=Penicillium angulare TaxID=116970 RepID=A0A9W9EUV6_9EURO|nr:hypothetical protein N7456_012018 [Penicillium angulare]